MGTCAESPLFQRASEVAELTLAGLSKFGLPPTPSCYALLYAYHNDGDRALVAAVDQALALPQDQRYAAASRVYDACLGVGALEESLGSAAENLNNTIANTVAAIKSAGDGNRGSGEGLVAAMAQFTEAGSPPEPEALRTILAETQAILARSDRLTDQLNDSAEEIAALRQSLDDARRDAHTDQLTGIGNRRLLDLTLRQAIAEAEGTANSLAVIMADVDHFKRFNDTHGHSVGDKVLKIVGRQFADKVIDGGTVARFGGEEFAAILPGADLDQAVALAETIRGSFEGRELRGSGGKDSYGQITLSFGAAAYRMGETAVELLDRADAGLYAAKRSGRNRVERGPEIL